MRRILSFVLLVFLVLSFLAEAIPAENETEQEIQLSAPADSAQESVAQAARVEQDKEERLRQAVKYQRSMNTLFFIDPG